MLAEKQFVRRSAFRVFRAAPAFVLFDAGGQVVGDTRIERPVTAFQNINNPVQEKIPRTNRVYGVLPEDTIALLCGSSV